MGRKTKIDYVDATWNPVTGCLHGCEYCYARRIAERFSGKLLEIDGKLSDNLKSMTWRWTTTHVLKEPMEKVDGQKSPYPFGFEPTFHRYRLDIPQHWTKPRTIFVCSMADLFGKWVPDEWIDEVFKACIAAPQHRYLFLSKNPARYIALAQAGKLPRNENFWYGSTATNEQMEVYWADGYNTFVSIEPILERFDCDGMNEANSFMDWIIIGVETGNRKGKVIPQKAWIDELTEYGKQSGVPVFMKESLREIMGDDFRQEFPWTD